MSSFLTIDANLIACAYMDHHERQRAKQQQDFGGFFQIEIFLKSSKSSHIFQDRKDLLCQYLFIRKFLFNAACFGMFICEELLIRKFLFNATCFGILQECFKSFFLFLVMGLLGQQVLLFGHLFPNMFGSQQPINKLCKPQGKSVD